MRKFIPYLLLASVVFIGYVAQSTAQTPQGFNYQAVLRDTDGKPISEQSVGVRISLQDQEGVNVHYTETHVVITSPEGVFSITVGEGIVSSGVFAEIPWSGGGIQMRVEADMGEGYSDLGTSNLKAVPFALFAADGNPGPQGEPGTDGLSAYEIWLQTNTGTEEDFLASLKGETGEQGPQGDPGPLVEGAAGQTLIHDGTTWSASSNIFTNAGDSVGIGTTSPEEKLHVQGNIRATGSIIGQSIQIGDPQDDPDEPLFVVRNSAGLVVFAVYESGVRVYVESVGEETKGSKGGFAVGGLSPSKQGAEFFRVTPDSVRIYIDTTSVGKGSKGGFAIGGLSPSKQGTEEYFRVTRDSSRIYVNSNVTGKRSKGGFAVGGLSPSKDGSSFMFLTPENYFIGHNSGSLITSGVYNSTLGYESGKNISTGESNSFMGYQSGFNNQEGSGNLFFGYQSGYQNVDGNYNTFLGYRAGFSNTDGENNSFLGSFAGQNNQTGNYNTFVGDSSGFNNTIGNNNSFIGTKAGFNNIDGYNNSFIGNYTGHSNSGGYSNVFIGNSSGFSNVDAGGNVFIGNESGYLSNSGWNNVYIGTHTGFNNLNGEGNVFLGYYAGSGNLNGDRNIFIGNNAGVNELGSNMLYVTNWHSDSTNSIIWGRMGYDWGDLANYKLRFNTPVGINFDPGIDLLSAYQQYGAGTISLFGDGDNDDYSALKLHASPEDRNHNYKISYTKSGEFYLGKQNGDQYIPRFVINDSGNAAINSFPEPNQSLFVYDDDNSAVLSLRGKGNEYDYASVRLEADEQELKRSYSLVHSKKNFFYLIYNDGITLYPRMLIDSLGRLTLNQWDEGTEMLDVNGSARFRSVGTSESSNIPLYITSDGTLSTAASDLRLKTNIESLTNALSLVSLLRGVRFNWLNNTDSKPSVGFIAQEVEKVLPEVVYTNPNDGYKGVNYAEMAAVLVEAVKEQQHVIENLNNTIERIQKENGDLKKGFIELKQQVEKLLMDKTSKIEEPPKATNIYGN